MEENKKLDNLFEQARKAKPVVGFDEVAAQFKENVASQNSDAKGNSGGNTNWIIASVAVVVLGAGGWFYLQSDKPVANQQEAVAIAPQPQNTSSTEAAPSNDNTTTSSSAQTESSVSNNAVASPEIISNTESPVNPVPATNNNKTKSKEEEALFAAGNSKNAPPPPIYKEVDGYENKSKTKILTGEAKVTSSARVGSKKSITIKNSKGSFKLNYLNGELSSLEKDSEEVAKADWNKYTDVIEKGNSKLAGSNSKAPLGANEFTQVMIKEMAGDNLFDENTRKVSLTKNEFVINDVAQPSSLHNKYLDLYKKIIGEEIGNNTVKFKR